VIFPGVGEASSAMKMLLASGLDTLIQHDAACIVAWNAIDVQQNRREYTGIRNFDVDVLKFSNKSSTKGWNTIYNLKSDLFKDIQKMNTCIWYTVFMLLIALNRLLLQITN
jgi:glutamine amidotransferase